MDKFQATWRSNCLYSGDFVLSKYARGKGDHDVMIFGHSKLMDINCDGIALRLTLVFALLFCNAALAKRIPVEQRDAKRQELNQKAEDIITAVTAANPAVQEELDNSAGYMVGVAFSAKALLVGGGSGVGLIYDKLNGSRTYINMAQLELGLGLGAENFRFLVIFQDRSALLRFRRGAWRSSLGSEAVIGEQDQLSAEETDKGFKSYVLSDTGANMSITVRLVRITVNYDLTDTGVANVSMPMRGLDEKGRQTDAAPRVWDHSLPFLAQDVIDKGFDLPLPVGLSLLHAHVVQDQVLDKLYGGLNGGEVVPFDFVAFENASSKIDSVQLRLDAWLFPFLNVYAMIGYTEGDAPMDVSLEGDGVLDYFDINCDKIISNPLCDPLEGQIVKFPVVAHPTGMTYNVGMVLAGGWKGYFAALPVNWTYAALDGRENEGQIFTITPRVGKVLDIGDYGNLTLFVGGNYLDTKLTISDSYEFPGEFLTIEYIVDQENKDKWNGVVGGSWEISRNWSLTLEYNGFFGSREAYVGSLAWRF